MAAVEQELAADQILGSRFRLVSRLGVGGMAEVWLAVDQELNTQVALKLLSAELATQQGFIDLLEAECDKTRDLLHPNIVRVYATYHFSGQHFIAMEYVQGRNLSELRGYPWQTVVATLLPLADALEYAHRAHVIHRDIKSSNILLDTAGVPRLMDFGIASVVTQRPEQQITTGGSLPAMSPQQLVGQPPTISDDIYSFGSLLYELISGAPLFAPDVTREKVLHERPETLGTRVPEAGAPEQLDKLVATMLEKEPARRPAGFSAVRAVLEEILEEAPVEAEQNDRDGAIRPVARRKKPRLAEADTFRPRPLQQSAARRPGAQLLYGGLGLLAALLVLVVFILPGMVADQQAKESATIPATVPSIAPAEPEVVIEQGSREVADNALADLLEQDDRLRALGVEIWGGADWAAARELAITGDDAYKARRYDVATEKYRQAVLQMQPLENRSTEVLATAIQDGEQAINDGNQLLALDRFDLALVIDSQNSRAQQGRSRALQLDQVLALMAQGSAAELEENWPAALQAYKQAQELDPQWQAARDSRERLQALIDGDAYQAAMTAGYAALSGNEYAAARTKFTAALQARPDDSAAQSALAQVANEQKLARIVALSNDAQRFAAVEQWAQAISAYEQILQLDAGVLEARNGLAASKLRLELDNRLNAAIANPDQLADDKAWEATRALLDYARDVQPSGAVLTTKMVELERLLQRARMPVAVRFESDNETEVVIYKVGRLGAFQVRDIDLRPGAYTAIGVRSGFRDVRRTFRVAPEVEMQSIVIRCEDPI